MNLVICFPKNMISEMLIEKQKIPCICKISNKFEILFSDTVPDVTGIVTDWDRKEIERRAVAGAGGEYTHFANSLVTLKKVGHDTYEIIYLSMFYARFGWCDVFIDGKYAPPGNFWDEE
ncbi:hypothetical protein L3067_14565 [Xanthomonas sp. PPL568]|uniref:hypothetical protein n=1 Tax=Xanthomonas indica TaxID=2912242 RepID=UPI001F56D66E|nr:hypothetical protein [Xanthomonas indica]MCI2245828.1 hypothetical protein [Xanthomonas indica]